MITHRFASFLASLSGLVSLLACSLLHGTAREDDPATFNIQVLQPFKVGDRVRMRRNIDETLGEAVSVGHSGPFRQL
jgi:hypothetical protein